MKKSVVLLSLLYANLMVGQRDYRSFQSPVKNQGEHGTCSAFGVAAAIETQPAIPADLSEQYLYAALKYSQPNVPYVEGDFLKNYVKSLQTYGLVHEEQMPYEPNAIDWEKSPTEFIRKIQGTHAGPVGLLNTHPYAKFGFKDNCIYLNGAQTQDVQTIKNILDNGFLAIAINYRYIHLASWFTSSQEENNPLLPTINVKINDSWVTYLNAKKTYTGKLIDDIQQGKLPYTLQNPTTLDANGTKTENYGAHVVTIVGYNDKGFIFKNSWGNQWGDNGYGYISFDAHRIMAQEALFFNGIEIYNTDLNKLTNPQVDIRLKTSGSSIDGKTDFALSLFTTSPNENFEIEKVTYEVFDMNSVVLATQTIMASNSTFNTFLWSPFKENLMPPYFLERKGYVKVVATIFADGKKIVRSYRCVPFMAQEHQAKEIQTQKLIVGDKNIESHYQSILPVPAQNLGFNYPKEDFVKALEKSSLEYTSNQSLNQFHVAYEKQDFTSIIYVFEKKNPVLSYLIVNFNTVEEAKKYRDTYYPLRLNLGYSFDFVSYQNGIKYKVTAWRHENKVYVATNMGNTKYSNL